MKKIKYLLSSILFLLPLISIKAYGNFVIDSDNLKSNNLESFNYIESNKDILIDGNIYIDNDTVLQNNLNLNVEKFLFVINEGKELIINGDLNISNNAKFIINGTLIINGSLNIKGNGYLENNGNLIINGKFSIKSDSTSVDTVINGYLVLNENASITIDGNEGKKGIIKFTNNTKFFGDKKTSITVYNNGVIIGKTEAFGDKSVIVNNYGGIISENISNSIINYNNYILYDEINDEYYTTLDEIPSNGTAHLISSTIINADVTIDEGITLYINNNKGLFVNGTLTVNGKIVLDQIYSYLKTYNLLGNGIIYLNKSKMLYNGYLPYVTILSGVSNDLTFDTTSNYIPNEGDIVFVLGKDLNTASMIAKNIKLSDKFNNLKVEAISTTNRLLNGGATIGKLDANDNNNSNNIISSISNKANANISKGANEVYYIILIALGLVLGMLYFSNKLLIADKKLSK